MENTGVFWASWHYVDITFYRNQQISIGHVPCRYEEISASENQGHLS